MATHMADYLCVVRFTPRRHVERDGEEAVFTTLHLSPSALTLASKPSRPQKR